MPTHDSGRILARRAFFSKFGVTLVGGAAAGAAAGGNTVPLQAQTTDAKWQAARHPQDDWYDQIPGRHRFVFDAPYPDGISSALQFLNNYYNLSSSEYGLHDDELASILVARHQSTMFGYGDAVWAKYGKPISDRINFLDPKTKQPPTANLYKDRLDGLIKRGLRLAVCQQATRGNAGAIAMAMGLKQDDVFEELKANLLPNARLVPVGILAVNRAQEHGYVLSVSERA
jgi:intracellular sulfur oxidation DsrE/DsrF family protein